MVGKGYQLLDAISIVAMVMRREVAESLAAHSSRWEKRTRVYLWGDGGYMSLAPFMWGRSAGCACVQHTNAIGACTVVTDISLGL